MAKTSNELKQQAKNLLEQAKKIQEKEFIKIGKLVMQLYKQNKITDQNLLTQINKIIPGKSDKITAE